MGPLHPIGRGSNGNMIREGELPRCCQVHVKGKGKNAMVENMAGKENIGVKGNPGLAILESSAINTNASNSGLGTNSATAKVKLSKELRSLGHVELDYNKKKRYDRLNPKIGERPFTPV
ncbi:hypothetical protein MA16_Dca007492 [Dendrobium catenatum]|uniref:Uncharacterized protein n=1 Tax=Dendrobium catenatum TaxID=906689 RepID=A0A2I0WB92_9ASPA|nr:hypothetical protein MA16_Dca007492 [Dendrobium catenatum]